MTKQDFIKQIAKYVQKYAPQYGIKVCSPIIAQACLESAYGASGLSAKYHNYFGLKCGSSWKGRSVNLSTKEEYKAGTYTTIKSNFRVYDSMEAGVKGYFDFIQLTRYSNLKGITSPRKYLETIKKDGYATSSKYVENNMAVIEKWDLTKYDSSSIAKASYSKTTKFVGVTTTELNVRKWPGAECELCSFSPLKAGTEIAVCDNATASNGNPWYYICYKGKYGFVSAKFVRESLISVAEDISSYMIANKFYYLNDDNKSTLAKAKKVKHTSCANFVCLCLQGAGLLKSGMMFYFDKNGIHYQTTAEYNKKNVQSFVESSFEIIKVGKKFSECHKLLKAGDVCGWDGPHTNIFEKFDSNGNAVVFDAGRGSTSTGQSLGVFTKMHRSRAAQSKEVLYYILRPKK